MVGREAARTPAVSPRPRLYARGGIQDDYTLKPHGKCGGLGEHDDALSVPESGPDGTGAESRAFAKGAACPECSGSVTAAECEVVPSNHAP
jgi:hypothetical protein